MITSQIGVIVASAAASLLLFLLLCRSICSALCVFPTLPLKLLLLLKTLPLQPLRRFLLTLPPLSLALKKSQT